MNYLYSLQKNTWLAILVCLLFIPQESYAMNKSRGFSAAASPPRFELKGKPGERVAEILTIHNMGSQPEQYTIRSNEWDFSEENNQSFADELRPGSCRPWIQLERHKISVSPDRPRRFRFEIHIPEDAQELECRFALLIEGTSKGIEAKVSDNISMPVTGRLGVIVYLAVDDASPQITVQEFGLLSENKQHQPYVMITNNGTAHGRLDSALRGVDARGTDFDISVSTMPILPGQTKKLILTPSLPGKGNEQKRPIIYYPLALKGELFWEGGSYKVNTIIEGIQ